VPIPLVGSESRRRASTSVFRCASRRPAFGRQATLTQVNRLIIDYFMSRNVPPSGKLKSFLQDLKAIRVSVIPTVGVT
jgi:hypothetical protein